MRFLAPLFVLGGLVVIFYIGLGQDPSELPSPFIDKPAPHFDLPALKNPEARVSSRDYADRTALVNVWATWCVGCRQEHEFLLQLAREKTLPIYGLNWRDRREDALSWLEQLGDPYVASGFDADGRVGIDWGVYGAPETFLIGRDGRVLYKHLGPLNRQIWEQNFLPRIATDNGQEG